MQVTFLRIGENSMMKKTGIHQFISIILLITLFCCGTGSASDDSERDSFISELLKGLKYYDDGNTEKAVLLINNASETYLHTNWSYTTCGYLLANMGEDEIALRHFDMALETDSTYARAWYEKGKALSRLGRTREAEECFLRAEELDERYEVPWTEKWPFSIIFRNLIPIYMVLAFGGLGIYIAKREGKL